MALLTDPKSPTRAINDYFIIGDYRYTITSINAATGIANTKKELIVTAAEREREDSVTVDAIDSSANIAALTTTDRAGKTYFLNDTGAQQIVTYESDGLTTQNPADITDPFFFEDTSQTPALLYFWSPAKATAEVLDNLTYHPSVEYSQGDVKRHPATSKAYQSLQNTNKGNPLTDTDWWREVQPEVDITVALFSERPDPSTLRSGTTVMVTADPDSVLRGAYTVTGPLNGAGTGYSPQTSTTINNIGTVETRAIDPATLTIATSPYVVVINTSAGSVGMGAFAGQDNAIATTNDNGVTWDFYSPSNGDFITIADANPGAGETPALYFSQGAWTAASDDPLDLLDADHTVTAASELGDFPVMLTNGSIVLSTKETNPINGFSDRYLSTLNAMTQVERQAAFDLVGYTGNAANSLTVQEYLAFVRLADVYVQTQENERDGAGDGTFDWGALRIDGSRNYDFGTLYPDRSLDGDPNTFARATSASWQSYSLSWTTAAVVRASRVTISQGSRITDNAIGTGYGIASQSGLVQWIEGTESATDAAGARSFTPVDSPTTLLGWNQTPFATPQADFALGVGSGLRTQINEVEVFRELPNQITINGVTPTQGQTIKIPAAIASGLNLTPGIYRMGLNDGTTTPFLTTVQGALLESTADGIGSSPSQYTANDITSLHADTTTNSNRWSSNYAVEDSLPTADIEAIAAAARVNKIYFDQATGQVKTYDATGASFSVETPDLPVMYQKGTQGYFGWDGTNETPFAGDDTGIIQPRLITYNNPALIAEDLVYGDIITADVNGTTTTDRLTLNLPGAEVSDRVMEITIQDIPSVSFDNGFLNVVAQPNGATPVQILTPNGLTTDSTAQVTQFDLKGSEISLVRGAGSNVWIMRSQLPGHTSDVWTGQTGAVNAPNPEFYKFWIHEDTLPPKVQFYSPVEAIWRDI